MLHLMYKRFGRLWVTGFLKERKNGLLQWICQCDCGNEVVVRSADLQSKHTCSCGCLQKEAMSETGKANRTHGYSNGTGIRDITYTSWSHMKQRCLNSNRKTYKDYGGRGIVVCDRWLKFENFLEDMGEKSDKNLSLDRIDNDGNYEPSNCRWAMYEEQNQNRRPFKKRVLV